MTLSRATIQSTIATKLDAVSGIENVYQGHRNTTDPNTLRTLYLNAAQNRLHAWFLERVATESMTSETHEGVVPIRTEMWLRHTFEIEFYLTFIDNTTQSEFDSFVDAVLEAFKNERTLGGWQAVPLQLTTLGKEYLGDALCHYARFTVDVIERLSGLTPA